MTTQLLLDILYWMLLICAMMFIAGMMFVLIIKYIAWVKRIIDKDLRGYYKK